jgi:hypothetical protein
MTTINRHTCTAGRGMIIMTLFAFCLLSSPLLTTSFMVVPSTTTTSTTTTASSLSMSSSATTLQHVSDFYQNFPIQSAVLTCGVKASVADTIAQIKSQASLLQSKTASAVTSKKTENNNNSNNNNIANLNLNLNLDLNYFNFWEGRRNLAYVLYGGIYIGLMSYLEYSYVFPSLFGYEKTIQILVEKVLFDNFFVAPFIWLPPAYIIKAWVYSGDNDDTINNDTNDTINNDSTIGTILKEGYDKYMYDIMNNNLLTMYWTIWLPAQTISFSVVPDHLRVVFMASISFFWFILFSTVASSSSSTSSSSTSSDYSSEQ